MSPSAFFARFCLFLLKYLSFMFAGNFTPEISNFVLVAITKFWLMRRSGHALILKGPGCGKEKHCKYFTVNVYWWRQQQQQQQQLPTVQSFWSILVLWQTVFNPIQLVFYCLLYTLLFTMFRPITTVIILLGFHHLLSSCTIPTYPSFHRGSYKATVERGVK